MFLLKRKRHDRIFFQERGIRNQPRDIGRNHQTVQLHKLQTELLLQSLGNLQLRCKTHFNQHGTELFLCLLLLRKRPPQLFLCNDACVDQQITQTLLFSACFLKHYFCFGAPPASGAVPPFLFKNCPKSGSVKPPKGGGSASNYFLPELFLRTFRLLRAYKNWVNYTMFPKHWQPIRAFSTVHF